jgi:hypothetical protein
MDNAENEPSASPTEYDSSKNSPLTPAVHQTWICTGDKQKDDLNMFTTGSFYDCSFKVSNDETKNSKVNITPHLLLTTQNAKFAVQRINFILSTYLSALIVGCGFN